MEFKKELTDLINKFSLDNKCNTPDYILCDYIVNCIETFYTTIDKRDSYSKMKESHFVENVENKNLFGVPLQKIAENQPQKPTPIPAEVGQKTTSGWSNPFGGTSWGV